MAVCGTVDARCPPTPIPTLVNDDLLASWNSLKDESVKILQDLIRIDTQNYGEDGGNESEAALYLKKLFDSEGIECTEVLEPKPGRGNIVARIRGDGSSGKGPLMLSAHLDTVKAPKEDWKESGWKHSPFSGHIDEEDGCLYGRGAVDMKNMAAMSAAILLFVARSGIKLSRDLIFAAVSDEERPESMYGARYLVEKHLDLINSDIILTEVGGFTMFFDGFKGVPVMIAEKGIGDICITSHGLGGHSSLFSKHNPIAVIGEVAHKLATIRLPHRVSNAARVSFEAIASFLPWYKRYLFSLVLSPSWHSYVLNMLPEKQYNTLAPLLFNVANPVIINGGYWTNQIPTSSSVVINCRVLPGVTPDVLTDEIKAVIGPERFKPEEEGCIPELDMQVLSFKPGYEQDPKDPAVEDVFRVIADVVSTLDNGTPVFPALIPGHTDHSIYINMPGKPVCLGFTPVYIPEGLDFGGLFHGTNERIPVSGFKWGVSILMETVFKLCDASN
jgi:acetylornithine deacetylase/succinyl-diaminopimelate desuccinylase-like protein